MTNDTDGPEAAPPAVRHELEAPKAADQLYQSFPNSPTAYGRDPQDGLPRPVSLNTLKDSEVPALTVEDFVCMADTSKFVRRDVEWGDVRDEYEPDAVERTPSGRYRLKLTEEKLASGYPAHRIARDEVEPIRPQCAHYARQVVVFPDDKEKKLTVRLCTARRTDEGEFLSVNDTAVYACELRSPPYGSETELIQKRDMDDIAAQKAAIVADDFDLDKALADEQGKVS